MSRNKQHAYRRKLFARAHRAVRKMDEQVEGVKGWSDFTPQEQLEAEQAFAEMLSNAKKRGRR